MSKKKLVQGADNPAYIDRWHKVPPLGKEKPRDSKLAGSSRGYVIHQSSGVSRWVRHADGVKTLGGSKTTTRKENGKD